MRMLAAVAIVAVLAGPALAADLPARPVVRQAPIVMTPYDWSGFYIGAHGGWAQAETKYNFANITGFWNTDEDQLFKHSPSGFLAGGHAGYNWHWGAVLVGVEGSYTWSDVKSDRDSSPLAPPGTDVFDTKVRWLATATARLGISSLNWLFYMRSGVAFAEIESDIARLTDPDGAHSFGKDTRFGWTIGFGIETMPWSPNWVLGIEGNYYDFGSFNVTSVTGANGAPIPGAFTNHNIDTTMWSVLGRVSYKFGGRAGPVVASY